MLVLRTDRSSWRRRVQVALNEVDGLVGRGHGGAFLAVGVQVETREALGRPERIKTLSGACEAPAALPASGDRSGV